VLLELCLEALEEGEGIRRGPREALMTTLPSVTCPSPPMATRSPRRTQTMVVPWKDSSFMAA
jgi:hypothetical protein